MSSNFDQIPLLTLELSANDRASEKLMYNVVTTLVLSFLTGCYSFLEVWRTTIKTWMSLNFGQIQPRTAELAALERLKKSP